MFAGHTGTVLRVGSVLVDVVLVVPTTVVTVDGIMEVDELVDDDVDDVMGGGKIMLDVEVVGVNTAVEDDVIEEIGVVINVLIVDKGVMLVEVVGTTTGVEDDFIREIEVAAGLVVDVLIVDEGVMLVEVVETDSTELGVSTDVSIDEVVPATVFVTPRVLRLGLGGV